MSQEPTEKDFEKAKELANAVIGMATAGVFDDSILEIASALTEERQEMRKQVIERERVMGFAGQKQIELEKQIAELRESLRREREISKKLFSALERTKKLTMGPSFELQDSIMVQVMQTLTDYESYRKDGSEK